MKLFHGTNIDFDRIFLEKCLPFKDFGKGFYLTDNLDQAKRMAIRKSRREGSPVVQYYELDDVAFEPEAGLKIKRFDSADEEWAEFILANRRRSEPPFSHDIDIVIGPIADDGIAYVLSRYEEGSYTLQDVAKELKFKHLNSQVCICTEKALAYLKRKQNE